MTAAGPDLQLLLVEDDPDIRELVPRLLAGRGVAVTATSGAAEGLAALDATTFQIAVLDLGLPDGSGLDVLAALRGAGSDAHVIVLSGASAEVDRVRALHLGADDYVVKPFFARELAARISSVKRRRDAAAPPGPPGDLRFGDLEIRRGPREVTVAGRPATLTAKEFDLLLHLADHPDRVHTRDDLLRAVWRSAEDWQRPSTVTEHVRRLRAKIEPDPARPVHVHTVRGVGYRFDSAHP